MLHAHDDMFDTYIDLISLVREQKKILLFVKYYDESKTSLDYLGHVHAGHTLSLSLAFSLFASFSSFLSFLNSLHLSSLPDGDQLLIEVLRSTCPSYFDINSKFGNIS
jgi:hypothetical protein